jgi:hypothetical protein
MKATPLVLVALILLAVPACGDDSASGSPPQLSALTHEPVTLTVGQAAQVTGSVAFADEDADVLELVIRIAAPSGTAQTLPGTKIAGVLGEPSGRIGWTVQLIPAESGMHTVELWVIDEDGHASNRLALELPVQRRAPD